MPESREMTREELVAALLAALERAEKAEGELAELLPKLDAAAFWDEQYRIADAERNALKAERDRAVAEAALLREALESLQDKQGMMMVGHPGSRHDRKFTGCSICNALTSAPLAEAAARVIQCAEAWVDSPTMESSSEAQLEAAVDALRAAREGKP